MTNTKNTVTEDLIHLLSAHNIKPTANRQLIIRTIADRGEPLSMHEIELRLHTVDKSVISRTIALFRERHLVHTIDSPDGILLFEACLKSTGEEDDDEHAHFFCTSCHRTFCLYDVPQPNIHVPKGFEARDVSVVVSGICPECKAKERGK